MLKLRKEQAELFEAEAVENFVQRTILHLRQELPGRSSFG